MEQVYSYNPGIHTGPGNNKQRIKVSGIFVRKTIRSLEHSFTGLFVPWNFRSQDRSLPGTFAPWVTGPYSILRSYSGQWSTLFVGKCLEVRSVGRCKFVSSHVEEGHLTFPFRKVPGNERSRERMVLGWKGLQCLFVSGTNGPANGRRNECSRERIVLRTNVPAFI